MSDSWLEFIPANERKRFTEKYKMSPEAYKQLREAVRDRGPEYIKQEKLWNEAMATLKFALETEPKMRDALKKQLERDVPGSITEGNFDIAVAAPSKGAHDQLVIYPEGNVSDVYPVSMSLTEQYLAQMQSET